MHNTSSKHNNATTKDKRSIFCPYLFCSENLPKDIFLSLSEKFKIRSLPSFDRLPPPVSSHADMLIFKHADKLVLHKDYYKDNSRLFDGIDYAIILSDEDSRPYYPHDILFNALALGDTVVASQKHISRFIAPMFENKINVRQGYAACSCCKVSDNAIITADTGIAKALKAIGKEVLLIEPGNIRLEGYGYGFIGGACFTYDDTVYFFGDIMKHPEGARITDFIHSQGKHTVSLCDQMLTDFGSALTV